MYVSKLPIVAKKAIATSVGTAASAFDTHSYPCLLTVQSGKAYLIGSENATATVAEGYPLQPGDRIEICGKFSLVSDSSADVRMLYYDNVS